MDSSDHNKKAWNRESEAGGAWSSIVSKEVIEATKGGRHEFSMSPDKRPIPSTWLQSISGKELLCLGGGGGQQGPILAAMGASVTVFDLSESQLKLDREASRKYSLPIQTIQGDMRDLSVFKDSQFDLVINPASTMFVDNVRSVWSECSRVLRPAGSLITSFMNPIAFAFGRDTLDMTETPTLKYAVPYSDLKNSSPEELEKKSAALSPFEFGHSLEDLIGGQLAAGFLITGFYEAYWGKNFNVKADSKFPQYIITRAIKQ